MFPGFHGGFFPRCPHDCRHFASAAQNPARPSRRHEPRALLPVASRALIARSRHPLSGPYELTWPVPAGARRRDGFKGAGGKEQRASRVPRRGKPVSRSQSAVAFALDGALERLRSDSLFRARARAIASRRIGTRRFKGSVSQRNRGGFVPERHTIIVARIVTVLRQSGPTDESVVFCFGAIVAPQHTEC